MDDFSVISEVRLDVQTLVLLLLLELNSPCLSHRRLSLGWQRLTLQLKIVKDGWENGVSIPGR